ncbi:MAG: hypothetical protein C5B49_01575 [Bdellovibrio sp.]|nr:MAG: hypothetical protein C5B49_01575 [Bdellovibrio sp.]
MLTCLEKGKIKIPVEFILSFDLIPSENSATGANYKISWKSGDGFNAFNSCLQNVLSSARFGLILASGTSVSLPITIKPSPQKL